MATPASKQTAHAGAKGRFLGRLEPHTVFLALALTFGLATLLANPPYQAPDENDHFYRAYQVSEGTAVGRKQENNSGGSLPGAVFEGTEFGNIVFHPENKVTRALLRRKWEKPFMDLTKDPRRFVAFPHTVVYPPTGYAAQAAAIFLGRQIHLGPLVLMYLARLAGLAVSIGLGYVALRTMPIFRWSCLLLLLTPMSLYLMGSVAPDGILIVSAFALVGLLVRLETLKSRDPDWKIQAGILALACVVATAKFVYLPLVLLVPIFVIPCFSDRRRKTFFGSAFVIVCLLPLLGWGRIIASLYVPGRTDIPIDPMAQWHHVIDDPLGFVSLMARSLWAESSEIYRWFVGTLGWGDTPLPHWYYRTYGWGLLACVLVESRDAIAIRWGHRVALLGAAVGSIVFICGAQYASWNAPGSHNNIEGIEGRYFLPIAVLIVVAFPPVSRLKAPAFCARLLGGGLGMLGAAVCLGAVIFRYYIP